MEKYFIIDFDSTLIQTEALEEYAQIVLEKHPDKEKILQKIKEITRLGMEGKLPFDQSLEKRLKLLQGTVADIKKTNKILLKKITPSVLKNKSFFKKYSSVIYIISGGFKEFILPIAKKLGLKEKNIFANNFLIKNNQVIGFDKNNPLSQKDGKVKAIKSLKLKGEVIVVGDGFTDYQIKAMGVAKHFIGFTENIKREIVLKKADKIVNNFDEFLYYEKLPRRYSYPKSKIKVVLFEHIHPLAISLFQEEGYQVDYVDKPITDKEFFEKIHSAQIIGIRSRTVVDQELLTYADNLLAIGAYCIGTNNIDLSLCSKQGIAVFNAPYGNTRSVAELVIGEIIFLLRNIIDKNNKLHQGIWDKSAKDAHEVRGKILGIVGYGNIGSQISQLAEGLGMKVYYYDIAEKLSLGNATPVKKLDDLLKIADVITVHVDGRKENHQLFGEKQFKMMKDGAIFINASRGFVVDLEALKQALLSKKLKGAAIDVFPHEPKNRGDQFVSSLQNLPNVILTPHIAGSTEEAQKNIAQYTTKKLIEYINTGQTNLSVNFPNVILPRPPASYRLLHIHENTPGILAQINKVFASYKINIVSQHLKTNETIGYVITDVNRSFDERVIEELKKIPHTIRFRLIY